MKKRIFAVVSVFVVLAVLLVPVFADDSTYSNYLDFTFDEDTLERMDDFTIVFDSSITLEHYYDNVYFSNCLRITDGTSSYTYYASDPFSIHLIICYNQITTDSSGSDTLEAEGAVFYTDVVGYNSGISVSYINGYDTGYNSGYNIGLSDGYGDGHSAGYVSGYNAGTAAVENNIDSGRELLTSVVEAPVNVFMEMFNFEILGINVFGLVTGILTLLLVATIIKKVIL